MESYEKKSEEAESEAEKLAKENERVDDHIAEAKRDWEAKQADTSVPGAVPDPAEDGESASEEEQ